MTYDGSLLQTIRAGEQTELVDEQFPFYPLNSPGMPAPGQNFIEAAISMGDSPPVFEGRTKREQRLVEWGPNLEYLYRRALYDENFRLPVRVKGTVMQAPVVPGHLYGADITGLVGGPRPAKVMIIGKNPSKEEVEARKNFVGPPTQVLLDALNELGVSDMERFSYYVCNLVVWPQLDQQSATIPAAHKTDCDILLHQTLRLVRPDYILCLGSDASKWLLGTQYGVQSMVGRVQELTFPVSYPGTPLEYHTSKVMAAMHPAAVYRTPEMYPEFKSQLGLFMSLTNGAEVGGREKFINHRNVYKYRELKKIVDEIRQDPDPWRRVIAVDGEWEGDHPENPGAYLRTVQFSSKHGEGITVVLRHQGGAPAFKPSIGHAVQALNELLQPDEAAGYYPRLGGHFFRADLPWLINSDMDIRKSYAPASAVHELRDKGGWDTGLMYHAVNETASYRLTDMTVRLTTAPVYDTRLKQHITDYCVENDIKKDDLEGYGFLPSWILHPEQTDPEWGDNYASYDADVTRRIAIRHLEPGGLLDSDWNGNNSWEPYWRSHRASLGVLEMEMSGIMLDKDRVDNLTTLFMGAKQQLLDSFRAAINWPAFNPESAPQCVAFLFGDRYTAKRDKQTNELIPIAPPGAMQLGLTPVKTTGKRSKLWVDVVSRGEQHLYSPSTDKEVLGILGHSHPLAMQLRDLKFITQVLKGPLRPPRMTADRTNWERDDTGHLVYDKGLAAAAQANGRVHTHISQNKETGRGSSARPPLQNISKRREGDYARILGSYKKDADTGQMVPSGDYLHIFPQPLYMSPIRTIFRASPGCVLVEADYTGAELAVIAWLSGDHNMIEHVRRNILPESHPDHYDIHSHTAVDTFQLQCAPTKKGLKEAGFSPLRVAAKNVNFGIPYGRSAEAIARQCKEEGVEVSVEDCQRMIDAYFIRYPNTNDFLAECRDRSQNDRWMVGSFGRYRRFIATRERSVIGEQERQAQNFPIQNTVADAVWQATYNFWEHKRRNPDKHFKLLLQIHDALLFEVPIGELRDFYDNVLDECMVENVPIWPRHLNNTPMAVDQPYHFGIDKEVQINWGEDIEEEQAIKLGIDLELI